MTLKTLKQTKVKKHFTIIFFSAFLAFLLTATFLAPLASVEASDPSSGTVNPTTGSSVTWNGTAPGGASPEGELTCVEGVNCDTFTLNVSGNPSDWNGKLIKVKISWTLPASDYDFYIHKGSVTGPEVDRSGEAPPVISEDAEIDPSVHGTGVYAVRVVYWAASGTADQYRGAATVENKAVTEEAPPVSTATAPTYNNFVPPSTLGQRAGEPSIGLNWATGKAMFIAALQTLRVTFDDTTAPATAKWENKSAPNTSITSFDPILFTDSQTNRTFVSQLLPSKMSLMSFTDNDGETWTPSQGSGINSGVDHQTVGGGPYARNADGSLKGNAIQRPGLDGKIYPNAVYYASQDIGLAEIARSDDGGLTFGVAVPMYDITQCGGLHGSIKVAPDGTVYVPNKGCGGQQAVAVSEDNGSTWNIRKIPGSKAGRTDPSVGIGSDGTIYVGYANGDGTPRIAVSRDKGKTFANDQNVGFYQGIKNTVFPAVTAGDPDRAAFFFLGTTTAGTAATGTDQTSPYVNAVWYAYISTTYDGGKTWVTVNATPNDPVQRGVICTNGTTCPSGTRNLLDFNDMEVDKQGRAVAGLADGCVSDACIQGIDIGGPNGKTTPDGQHNTRFDNDGARRALIIRQSGGLGLFSAFDPPPVITTVQIEDNDPRVQYSTGWHSINNANASDNRFGLHNGGDPTHFARLAFDVTGQTGSITYHFAKSTKGGRAEIILDGVSKGFFDYSSSEGSRRDPVFGSNITFDNLSSGPHTLELKNLSGSVYIDRFTLTSASPGAGSSFGPRQTTSSSSTVNAGGELLQSVTVESGTTAISVLAETNADAPIKLALVDPSGSVLQLVEASDGVAVINAPVTQSGTYLIKVVNLSAGSLEVFTATTPFGNR